MEERGLINYMIVVNNQKNGKISQGCQGFPGVTLHMAHSVVEQTPWQRWQVH